MRARNVAVTKAFVSYSRCDVGFANTLTGKLEGYDIACWLDIAQLAPGSDWADSIDRALDECDALVLVASRESVASPHCRAEWSQAEAAGKRLVIAGIEPVAIPAELGKHSVVDMRRRGAWSRLAALVLANDDVEELRSDELAWYRVPRPLKIAAIGLVALLTYEIVTFAQMFHSVGGLTSGRAFALDVLVAAELSLFLASIVFTVRWLWRFLQREKTARKLYAMALIPLAWAIAGFTFPGETIVLLGLALVWPMVFLNASVGSGLRTWLPARPRLLAKPSSSADANSAAVVTDGAARAAVLPSVTTGYLQFYDRHDALAARRIDRLLESSGLRPAHFEDDAGAVCLLSLSNATPTDFAPLRAAGTSTRPVVCIALSSIALGSDLAPVQRLHWIDYRARNDLTIEALARWLSTGNPAVTPTLAAEDAEPASLDGLKLPVGVSMLQSALLFLAAVVLCCMLTPLLERTFSSRDVQPAWGLLSGFLAALLAVTASTLLVARVTTLPMLVVTSLVGIGLFGLWGAAPETATGGGTSGGLGLLAMLAVIGGAFVYAVASVSGGELRSWFLAEGLPWRSSENTLAASSVTRLATRQTALAFGAGVASSIILASNIGLGA